jgi:hypothetical protein
LQQQHLRLQTPPRSLQRITLGLREEEEHNKEFDKEPADIDAIIAPAHGVHCNRVDELIEEERRFVGEDKDGHAHSADAVGEDLDL